MWATATRRIPIHKSLAPLDKAAVENSKYRGSARRKRKANLQQKQNNASTHPDNSDSETELARNAQTNASHHEDEG